MADANDVRGVEQQRPQGQLDSNFYANNNLDVRIAPQQWQADANANAQRHVPSFDLQTSDTRNGANKNAPQQNPDMVQDRNRTNKPPTAPRPESAGDKIDTSDVKWGTNDKGNAPDNKLKDKAGEAAPKSAADAANGEQTMEKTDVDPKDSVDPNKEKQEMEKLPADATSPDGEEHIPKSAADATEDESAGSFQGGSFDAGPKCDAETSRVLRSSGIEQEQERARTAYEAVTGTSAPRVFNSVGEGLSVGRNAVRDRQ